MCHSIQQEVYDTGTHRETELFTNGQYVFDGAEYTNWTADCRVSLGGCPARTVSVGADITGLAPWLQRVPVLGMNPAFKGPVSVKHGKTMWDN
jgi:hypothetical protein